MRRYLHVPSTHVKSPMLLHVAWRSALTSDLRIKVYTQISNSIYAESSLKMHYFRSPSLRCLGRSKIRFMLVGKRSLFSLKVLTTEFYLDGGNATAGKAAKMKVSKVKIKLQRCVTVWPRDKVDSHRTAMASDALEPSPVEVRWLGRRSRISQQTQFRNLEPTFLIFFPINWTPSVTREHFCRPSSYLTANNRKRTN